MKLLSALSILAAASLTLAGLSSCGDKAVDRYPWVIGSSDDDSGPANEDKIPDDIAIVEKELRQAIPFMINYSHEPTGTWAPHKYQYQRANNIDNYAGYWTVSKGSFTFGGPLPTLYNYPNDYLGGADDPQLFTNSKNAILYAVELGKPEWRAVALIIQAYLGHEVTDFYGAMPFNDYRNGKTESPLTYDRGADIYDQIFEELEEARQILMERQPSETELAKIEDIMGEKSVSRGDWTRWVKFANCIQLRMAMNIVKYDPAKAQQKAEEAVAQQYGVLTNADTHDLGYYQGTHDCCLYFICNTWHDLRLSASIENIMKHFKHPLLYRWFDINSYAIDDKVSGIQTPAGTDVFGVRNGIMFRNLNVTGKDKGGYGPFSTLSGEFRYMHQDFFKRAECDFLRAEGALRGWNMGGTAQEFYEAGIRIGFMDNGITDEAEIEKYMNQTECPVVDYVDPYQSQHNIKGRVAVNVKWDEADDNETKLEKIISQKYIANFPMSAEAWTTFRRTGYPRLFPVYVNNMPEIDTELQIRRMPKVETGNNVLDIASLEQALGGPQNGATRVFWDIETETRGEDIEGNGFGVVIPHNF